MQYNVIEVKSFLKQSPDFQYEAEEGWDSAYSAVTIKEKRSPRLLNCSIAYWWEPAVMVRATFFYEGYIASGSNFGIMLLDINMTNLLLKDVRLFQSYN